MKIFLSPSNQTANVGAYKGTNECEQCERMANYAKNYLVAHYNCEVMVANRSDNMNKRCDTAKSWGADFYLAIHTNAFYNTAVHGTETYYYSHDAQGKAFATALLNNVSALTKCKRSTKVYDNLIELNQPICPRSYIEVDFHSNPTQAAWIVENAQTIGEMIAETIATHFNIVKRNDKTYTLTAILNGLAAEQAEKTKGELEAAGYTVTITEQIQADKDASEKTEESETTKEEVVEATVIAKGDRVKLSADAVVYGTSRRFAAFVYRKILYVREISGDRAVISTVPTGAVTGAVDKKYLIKI